MGRLLPGTGPWVRCSRAISSHGSRPCLRVGNILIHVCWRHTHKVLVSGGTFVVPVPLDSILVLLADVNGKGSRLEPSQSSFLA